MGRGTFSRWWSRFLARAVVDDVLPPALVKHALTLLSPDDDIVAITALNYCGVQLGARHAAERVLQLWGDDVGLTVDAAKHKVRTKRDAHAPPHPRPLLTPRGCVARPRQVELLITEYLDAGDVPEATRCLRALKMPFFHHELVKKSLVHAIEKPSDHPVRPLPSVCSTGITSACASSIDGCYQRRSRVASPERHP
jgi:hypothetical protein